MRGAEVRQRGMPPNGAAKALGAFYTGADVAEFLVWWAVRSPRDTALDPSFGGGVFLRAACRRLRELGGRPAGQVWGVEIDADVHAQTAGALAVEFGVPRDNLLRTDFFRLTPQAPAPVGAIVGNPPFIRYQRFTGEARKLALDRCAAQGVRLPELSSSWAPFLVHSTTMLRPGGRLAMVVPMEIAHAAYALPVLDHLRRSFGTVTFLTFRGKLFPDLSEDTLLLLAEAKGAPPAAFRWRDFPHAGPLATIQEQDRLPVPALRKVDAAGISEGRERLVEYFLPAKARDLYRQFKGSTRARRLGALADVGIGYVTGANEFFHLSPAEARRRGIPERFLRPAVRRGRALSGLRFTAEDWRQGAESGEAGYLLHIDETGPLPASVEEYLRSGEEAGVPKAYKCRTRSPWFRVPHVHLPDAFLSYMSGSTPRLVANDAGAVAPNSLHALRLHPGTGISGDALAALWQTSLVRLSAEIEGHALGGGMLKLEPTEAENVLVPWPERALGPWLVVLARELDARVRNHSDEAAQDHADRMILQQALGLSDNDCAVLRQGAVLLRGRRYGRGAPDELR